MAKKNILHYGLQRSGTNFLENLLKENFQVSVLNQNDKRDHPLQKHFRLYDEKHLIPEDQYANDLRFENLEDYLISLELKSEVEAVFLISKDPYSWYLSYCNWAKKCEWPKVDHHYIQEYNLFYSKWLEFSKNDSRVHFLKYIDLISNPQHELNIIIEKYGFRTNWKNKFFGNKTKLSSVPHSRSFTSDKISYYKNEEYLKDYSDQDLREVNNLLDTNVVQSLGYTVRS